jgi:signal transduction histidine kinase
VDRSTENPLTVQAALDKIAGTAAQLLESPVAGVFLLDPDGERFDLVAGHGFQLSHTDVSLRRGASVAGAVISSGRAVRIGDLRSAPLAALPKLIGDQLTGSLVVTPIISGDRSLGVIEAFSPRVDAFADWHTTLLEALGSAAATVLDNARLHAAEQQARREAVRLQALTGRLGRSLNAQDVLDDIAATAAELMDSPVAGVFLLDEGGQHFDLVAGQGLDLRAGMRLPRDGSLASRVIASGKPVSVPDVRLAGVTALPKLVSGEVVGSLVVAPIISPNGPLGVVEVYSTSVAAFEQHHAELLDAMAGAAAAVLENARLYRAREQDLAQLRTIMERLPVGVLVADASSGEIILHNRLAEEQFGTSVWANFRAGRLDPRSGVHAGGEAYAAEEWPLARALLHGEVVSSERIELARADGGATTLNVSAAPITDPSGKIVAAVAVYDDVSNEVALRRQRDEFLSAAAHDLKTPLTGIRGLVQLLARQLGRTDISQARIANTLRGIESGTRKMTGLIDELLDISRLETVGELSLSRRAIDLVELTRRVIDDQTRYGQEHAIVVDAPVEAIIGHWDEARLERAIVNLLGNAIKYSPRASDVEVTIREAEINGEKWAVLSVTDHGIGIPASDIERIFERFTRGSNVPEKLPGSGIGLSYVHQIVVQHGGSVSVRSQPGAGSTFTLKLPREPR